MFEGQLFGSVPCECATVGRCASCLPHATAYRTAPPDTRFAQSSSSAVPSSAYLLLLLHLLHLLHLLLGLRCLELALLSLVQVAEGLGDLLLGPSSGGQLGALPNRERSAKYTRGVRSR